MPAGGFASRVKGKNRFENFNTEPAQKKNLIRVRGKCPVPSRGRNYSLLKGKFHDLGGEGVFHGKYGPVLANICKGSEVWSSKVLNLKVTPTSRA